MFMTWYVSHVFWLFCALGVDFVGKGRGKVMTRKERRKFMRSQKKDHRRTHKRGPLHTSETRTDVDKGHHKSPVPSLHLPPSNAVSTEKEAVTNHGQASKKVNRVNVGAIPFVMS